MTASRRGFETLLRRLVLGGCHKNIRQVIGTITGVSRSASNPEYIDRVTIRTTAGAREINAALVVGLSTKSILCEHLTNRPEIRLHRCGICWYEMAAARGIRTV